MSGPGDQDMDETPDDNTPEDVRRSNALSAAELSLGLLEGEELLEAKGRLATDEGFAWRKVWWDNWFAPLTDEVKGAEPSREVWERISAHVNAQAGSRALAANDDSASGNVVELNTRLRRWQWATGFASAAAAALAAVAIFTPGSGPAPAPGATDAPQFASASPLVAQVPIGETGLRLDVTYIPDTDTMLVGAIGLTADGVHDHELWLVPADGSELQSLGVVEPGEVRSMEVPADIVSNLGNGVGLVLTREPIGGKPEGVDAGPVVASGNFSQV